MNGKVFVKHVKGNHCMDNLHFYHSWHFYLNGCYHHDKISFLPNGQINHHGTEGFYRWEKVNSHTINLYDEVDLLCYTLEYRPSAKLWISIAQHRVKNNDVFLALSVTDCSLTGRQKEIFEFIANKGWAYRSGKGEIWGHLFFGIDGKIYHYNHPNESFWYIQDDRLYIMNQQKEITSISQILTGNHRMIELDFLAGGGKHYLEWYVGKVLEPVKYLHLDVCFSNRSDVLLVTINSAAHEYNGYENKFEFHKLPYIYGVDYVRISQSAPTRWYVDDFDKIKSIIHLNEYKKIVIQGLSIGGFAALWLAENLARNNPHIQYESIAIQPLTSLDMEFLQYLRKHFSDGFRSKTPTDELLSHLSDDVQLDILKMLELPLSNVRHYILYDRLNLAEKYSSERLQSNRVSLIGLDLNVSHGQGSGQIANSTILTDLQKKILG